MTEPSQPGHVSIQIPARAEFVAVFRAAAAVVASRADFDLDDIDDLRMLIDEAASLLLLTGAQGELRCELEANPGSITFVVTVTGDLPGTAAEHDVSLPWTILRALAHEVTLSDDHRRIVVTRQRGPVLDSAT